VLEESVKESQAGQGSPDTTSEVAEPSAGYQRRLRVWIQARLGAYLRDWNQKESFDWRSVAAIIAGTVILFPLFVQLPNLGLEWYHFDLGTWDVSYPPWMPLAISPLKLWGWRTGLALLTGLLFMSTAVAAAREARMRGRASMLGAAALAVTTAPVLMLTWLGNVAPLTLFGLVALPFGIPWATLQPHLAPWALLARRQWTIWGIAFLALTFLIWGFWFSRYFTLSGILAHPIAMGWQNLGFPFLVIGLVMLVFTNADPLRLIAVGAFVTPYLMPHHLLLLPPAIGRTQGYARLVLWGSAWLTLFPPMFAPHLWAKYVAMLFPLVVWWLLRPVYVYRTDRPLP